MSCTLVFSTDLTPYCKKKNTCAGWIISVYNLTEYRNYRQGVSQIGPQAFLIIDGDALTEEFLFNKNPFSDVIDVQSH